MSIPALKTGRIMSWSVIVASVGVQIFYDRLLETVKVSEEREWGSELWLGNRKELRHWKSLTRHRGRYMK